MKQLITILLFLLATMLHGQLEPRVTQGHNFRFGSINFSANGKYAVSLAGDDKLILWDVNFKKEIKSLAGFPGSQFGGALSTVDISDDGKYLTCANVNELYVWELGENFRDFPKYLKNKFKGCSNALFMDNERVCLIHEDRLQIYNLPKDSIEFKSEELKGTLFLKCVDGQRKVAVTTDGSVVTIFDLANQKLIATFDSPIEEPLTFSIHPTKNLLLIAGNEHEVTECDFSGKIIRSFSHEAAAYLPICHYLGENEIVGISHNKLYKWKNEICTVQELATEVIIASPHVKNNKLVIGNWDFSTGIIDLNRGDYQSFEVSMAHCEGISVSANGFTYKGRDGIIREMTWSHILEPNFVVGNRDQQYVNVQTLGNLHTFYHFGDYYLTANQKDIVLIDNNSATELNRWKTESTITSMCGNETTAYDVSADYTGSKIYKTDLKTFQRTLFFEIEDRTITHIVFSDENGLLAFCDGSFAGPSKILAIAENGKIKNTIEGDKSGFTSVALVPASNSVLFSHGGFFQVTKLVDLKTKEEKLKTTGRVCAYNQQDKCIAVYNNEINSKAYGIQLMDLSGEKIDYIKDAHQAIISHLTFSNDGNYLISASWDKSIKIWDWKNKKLLLTIYFSSNSFDFYLFSDESYYFTSKAKIEDVYFLNKDKIIPFQQYDLQLNRPDKILEVFKESDTSLINFFISARVKRLERLGIKEATEFSSLDIPNEKNLKIEIDHEKHQFLIYNPSLDDIIKLNGVKINWRIDLEKKGLYPGMVYYLPMVEGRNQVEIFEQNRQGIQGKSQFFQYTNITEEKSNLYLINLAASEFQDESFNLAYASKDANDISAYFNSNWRNGEVNNLKLLDKDFTLSSMSQVTTFLSSAKMNDVVMVFISSHGVFDANLNYYIATHDLNFMNPSEKGLNLKDLEAQLAACKSTKKVVFIDACHSGEIDKTEITEAAEISEEVENMSFRSVKSYSQTVHQSSFLASKNLFVDLSSENGISFISSAAGVEFAIEGDEWKNGVFTFALLDALKNFKADMNGDRQITLLELEKYLVETVPTLTKGKQQPNSRVKNPYLDFVIQEMK